MRICFLTLLFTLYFLVISAAKPDSVSEKSPPRDLGKNDWGQGIGEHQNWGQGIVEQQNWGQGIGEHQNWGQGIGEHQNWGQGIVEHQNWGQGIGEHQNLGQGIVDHQNWGQGIGEHQIWGQGNGEHHNWGQGIEGHENWGQGVAGQENWGQGIEGNENWGSITGGHVDLGQVTGGHEDWGQGQLGQGSWQGGGELQGWPNLDNTFNPSSRPPLNNFGFPEGPSDTKVCSDCVCGINKLNRIVNGDVTSLREFPWMVRIVANGNHHCGASLITRRHILTAAHCLLPKPGVEFSVYLADEIQRDIISIRPHLAYDPVTQKNDIAIIELAQPVTFDARIRPICLPDQNADFTGKTAVGAGWGWLMEGGTQTSFELRKVELPIIAFESCRSTYSLIGLQVTDTNICADGSFFGKDTCQGDSGGPLEIKENGRRVLAGIISFGNGCAKPGYPGVYTRVSAYLPWINSQIGNECICSKTN